MSSSIDLLRSATININIYVGLFVSITGIFGGLLNIIVFTTLRIFRQTRCTIYLTTASVANLGQSLTVLIRVFSIGFNYSPLSSSILCKFRFFLSQYFSSVSLTCMCMATIDQYLSMTQYRQFNNMRLARYHIAFSCTFWFIHSIFTFIFYDSNGMTCIMTNGIFIKYVTYFYLPILLGFLPLSITSIFALLALNKIIKIANQQIDIVRFSRDRQLTSMALVHTLFMILTTIPFVVAFIYTLTTTTKSLEQAVRIQLIYTITTFLAYECYACPFYIYSCVSKRFRKQFVYVLFRIHLNRFRHQINNLNNNQVVPT